MKNYGTITVNWWKSLPLWRKVNIVGGLSLAIIGLTMMFTGGCTPSSPVITPVVEKPWQSPTPSTTTKQFESLQMMATIDRSLSADIQKMKVEKSDLQFQITMMRESLAELKLEYACVTKPYRRE